MHWRSDDVGDKIKGLHRVQWKCIYNPMCVPLMCHHTVKYIQERSPRARIKSLHDRDQLPALSGVHGWFNCSINISDICA